VFLSVETIGYFAIDFEYLEMIENFTPQPEPSEMLNPEPESMTNPVPEVITIGTIPVMVNPVPVLQTIPSPQSVPDMILSPETVTIPSPNTMPNPNTIPSPQPNPQPNSNMMPCPISSPNNSIPYSDLDMVNETTNSSYWFPIVFTPTNFLVTILFNNTDIFYSYSNETCMPILDYWEDDILGCPCNSTWNTSGYYDPLTNSFQGGRNIAPSQCPPNTCQETFFLNDTQKYANLRLNISVYNGTVSRTLEITKMSICKEIGYGYDADDILYSFSWGQGQLIQINDDNNGPVVVTTPGTTVTYSNGSDLLPLSMIMTIMSAFLLMLV
jgi:hypothetical protein